MSEQALCRPDFAPLFEDSGGGGQLAAQMRPVAADRFAALVDLP